MRIVETESYKLISAGWFDKIFPTQYDIKPSVQQELGVKIQDVKKTHTKIADSEKYCKKQ